MIKTETKQINLTPSLEPVVFRVSQGDSGSRTIQFVVSDYRTGGVIKSASIEGTKPDNTVFAYEAEIVETQQSTTITKIVINATVTGQMTAVAGKVRGKLKLKDADGNVLNTSAFLMVVDAAAYDKDKTDTSQTEIPSIVQDVKNTVYNYATDTVEPEIKSSLDAYEKEKETEINNAAEQAKQDAIEIITQQEANLQTQINNLSSELQEETQQRIGLNQSVLDLQDRATTLETTTSSLTTQVCDMGTEVDKLTVEASGDFKKMTLVMDGGAHTGTADVEASGTWYRKGGLCYISLFLRILTSQPIEGNTVCAGEYALDDIFAVQDSTLPKPYKDYMAMNTKIIIENPGKLTTPNFQSVTSGEAVTYYFKGDNPNFYQIGSSYIYYEDTKKITRIKLPTCFYGPRAESETATEVPYTALTINGVYLCADDTTSTANFEEATEDEIAAESKKHKEALDELKTTRGE